MAHRLHYALKDGGFDFLRGEVEPHETFMRGKARNMHLDKRQRGITGTGA